MDVDPESEMNLSCKESSEYFCFMNFVWVAKQRKQQETCSTMGEDTPSIRTAQHWFNRFKSGNFELNDS